MILHFVVTKIFEVDELEDPVEDFCHSEKVPKSGVAEIITQYYYLYNNMFKNGSLIFVFKFNELI